MRDAAAAADMLIARQNTRVTRALETGLVVSYCRAFTKGEGLKKLTRNDVPAEYHELHDWLLRMRHKVYAHTDVTAGQRSYENTGEMFGLGFSLSASRYEYGPFQEKHIRATAAALDAIGDEFDRRRRELHAILADAAPDSGS